MGSTNTASLYSAVKKEIEHLLNSFQDAVAMISNRLCEVEISTFAPQSKLDLCDFVSR